MRIRTLVALLIAFVMGFILATALQRPAKVKAAGIVHVNEVSLGGIASTLGGQVVGFSCAQDSNDQKIHCFLASE
jgi:hypothetical protein